jgi:hypothetical protein
MIMQNVSAAVRNANEIEVTAPVAWAKQIQDGRLCFAASGETLTAIMEAVTNAIEERFSPKEAAKNPTVEPKNDNVMNETATAAPATPVAPVAPAKSALTYRSIRFQVLREAKGPISIQEACEAAKPLVEQMGATGKTPMDSFKAKFYMAAKRGEIIRVGTKFALPESGAAPAEAAAPAPAAPAPETAPAPEAPAAA